MAIPHPITSTERWLAVVGYEGRYEVSDHGRVRSLVFRGKPRAEPFPLKLQPRGACHLGAALTGTDGHVRYFMAHRLVLAAFVGPPPGGKAWCLHFDDDPHNNHVNNLRWGSPLANAADRKRNGGNRAGSRNGNSKLSEAKVSAILWYADQGIDRSLLSRRFDVTPTTIGHISTRVTWAHMPVPKSEAALESEFRGLTFERPALYRPTDGSPAEARTKAIKLAMAVGDTQAQCIRRFGISPGMASLMARGFRWAHIVPTVEEIKAEQTRRAAT